MIHRAVYSINCYLIQWLLFDLHHPLINHISDSYPHYNPLGFILFDLSNFHLIPCLFYLPFINLTI